MFSCPDVNSQTVWPEGNHLEDKGPKLKIAEQKNGKHLGRWWSGLTSELAKLQVFLHLAYSFSPIGFSPTAESVLKTHLTWGFLGGAVVENLPANAGDTGSSPGLGGSHMQRSN